ncbi:unnamed protein product [Schistosoma mattheei]|uniref:Gamma tubulin complex component C-terminal domain-containing protein n=1 Tax=Schistosoma mattheei TaxID=31246 RepID=A0AA85C2M2_9TREM|nr:unnamed protein product [Schistosoma mattheei]
MISTVCKQTSQPLLETLIGCYNCLDHLRATRQFSHLRHGDFIQHVMDLLGSNLNESCSQLLIRRLSGMSKTTMRDPNTKYEQQQILQRLAIHLPHIYQQVKILTRWDTFSLDYHVDGALATILTAFYSK